MKTYLSYESSSRHLARIRSGDYDILPNTLVGTVPDPADLLDVFVWPSEYSASKWSDPVVTDLINRAKTISGAERLLILETAERKIMEATPCIPVMFERTESLLAAEVQGWYPDPLGRQALRRLRLNTPNTQQVIKEPHS